MATSITPALRQIKRRLNDYLTPDDIENAAAGHVWRQRVLGPFLTVQALLLQILRLAPQQ